MAKVYDGRVAIPGDMVDDYLKLMQEAQRKREPFRRRLMELSDEFYEHLLARYSERTARKHSQVVDLFIEFICGYTDAEQIEEITRGVVNTHFRRWWKRKVWDSTTPDQLRVALKKFFGFLASEKNIPNEKVLKALQ